MKTLSNYEIANLIKETNYERYFGGCYDDRCMQEIKIKEDSRKTIAYFILYTSSKRAIGHWVLLYFFKGTPIFFDPFGAPPSEEILQFVSRVKAKRGHVPSIIQNTEDLQALVSNSCGYFCLYTFLHLSNYVVDPHYLSAKEALIQVLREFKANNQNYNEKQLQQYFQ